MDTLIPSNIKCLRQIRQVFNFDKIKLMNGKAPRKQSLHEKTTASVLLKPFISSNKWCHTTDAT